jgi:hypothetical protein
MKLQYYELLKYQNCEKDYLRIQIRNLNTYLDIATPMNTESFRIRNPTKADLKVPYIRIHNTVYR